MAKLYQYAVIKEKKEDSDGNVTEPASLVVDLTTVLCEDDKQAQMVASRAIPEEEMVNIDRLTVAVRPF